MSLDLLDIACEQRGEVRMLASTYVARYGQDALPLARMALDDVVERGRGARAELYADAIMLLSFRARERGCLPLVRLDLRMTINHATRRAPVNLQPVTEEQVSRMQYFSYA